MAFHSPPLLYPRSTSGRTTPELLKLTPLNSRETKSPSKTESGPQPAAPAGTP